MEYFQLFFGWAVSKDAYSSAFSGEDFVSNRLGTEFQDQWDSRKEPSLGDAIEEYMKSIGANDQPVSLRPGFDELPETEQDWQEMNRFLDPWRRWARDYWTGDMKIYEDHTYSLGRQLDRMKRP